MQLISFSGLDGSGKTTQIDFFVKSLRRQKKKVRLIHIVKNSVANRFRSAQAKKEKEENFDQTEKAIKEAVCDQSGQSKEKDCVWGVLLRKLALLVDVVLFRLFLLIGRCRYDVIVCDRYFYDYLINIYYLAGTRKPNVSPLLRHLIPKPDLAIYLKIAPDQANKRKQDQGLDYLKKKERLFGRLKDDFDLEEVDAETTKEATAAIIEQIYQHI